VLQNLNWRKTFFYKRFLKNNFMDEEDKKILNKASFSFWSAFFTWLSLFTFILSPMDILTGMFFAASTGVAVWFSYKSIKQKQFKARLAGTICMLILTCLICAFAFFDLLTFQV